MPRRVDPLTPGGEALSDDPAPLVADAATLLEQCAAGYREFLAVPALSLGLFVAPSGEVDEQDPHDRDEVYVILEGEAVLDIAGVAHAVTAGSVAYVPAGVQHHFAAVHTDLRVLVLFAGETQ